MKTYHELNEAAMALIDENGNRKPFEQFYNDVLKINETYNRNYLRAEYNFVQASADMAAKWEDFLEDADEFNLQYRTAADGHVRPEHAALHGVTLPMDDPFWDKYYPPNGWNCRCTVIQVLKEKYPETEHDKAMQLGAQATDGDKKHMFEFNPGKQQKTVPDYNPYTISRCRDCDIAKGKIDLAYIPENEVCAACRFLRTCTAQRFTPEFRQYRDNVKNSCHVVENVTYSNLTTNLFYQTRTSLKRAFYHVRTVEEATMMKKIISDIISLNYIRSSELGEGKDMSNENNRKNIEKKERRGVTRYHVYHYKDDRDNLWEVKTEEWRGKAETLYCLRRL